MARSSPDRPRPRTAPPGGRGPCASGRSRRPSPHLLPSLRKHQTLEELAYQDIRQAIVAGRFAPGQRLVVNALAAASGVSRIPIMQALRRLETEGFVRITPRKEVAVSTLSPDEFRERFLLMAMLESLCLREASGKLTPSVITRLRRLHAQLRAARKAGDTSRAVAADGEFHQTLWRLSGLPRTVQFLQNLWDRGEYYRIIMHARRGGFAEESLLEHEEIFRALAKHDLQAATAAIERHRLQAMQRLRETT